MIKAILALSALALIAAPGVSAPCRDAKGKFVKCPPTATTAKASVTKGKDGKCRDSKGHFAKCP